MNEDGDAQVRIPILMSPSSTRALFVDDERSQALGMLASDRDLVGSQAAEDVAAVRGLEALVTGPRLLVQLPDKYPGQDLVFITTVASASATVALTSVTREIPS